jgi:hypothetical protein
LNLPAAVASRPSGPRDHLRIFEFLDFTASFADLDDSVAALIARLGIFFVVRAYPIPLIGQASRSPALITPDTPAWLLVKFGDCFTDSSGHQDSDYLWWQGWRMPAAQTTKKSSDMKLITAFFALALSAFAQSVVIGPAVFSGSGLNDATSGGRYTPAAANAQYVVTISATGAPDQFTWTKNGGSASSPVAITSSAIAIADGVTITFAATTGHTIGANWTITVTASGNAGTFVQAGLGARVQRSVQDRLRETMSVKDFGARGDGVSDDTASIALAVKAARKAGLGLYFPPSSKCYLTDTITDLEGDDHWFGSSTQDTSCLQSRSGGAVIAANAGEIDRIEIDHLKIVGTGATGGSTVTDGVSTGGTTITSATANFQPSIVGTPLYFAGGSGSVAGTWRHVTARASTTSITVSRAVAASTGMTIAFTGAGISIRTTSSSSSINIHHIRFDNINGTCLYIPNSFSIDINNIEAKCGKSNVGNGLDVDVGNTGHIHDTYIYDVGSSGGVGYRIHSGYFLCTNCNGINNGPYWGVFGDNTAEDGAGEFARFILDNANVEGFSDTGIRVKTFSCLASFNGGKIEGGGTGSPRTGIIFDANHGCLGYWNNVIVTSDGAGWANGQAIHYSGAGSVPFINFGGGLSGAGTNVLTAWVDSSATSAVIPSITTNYDGSFLSSIKLNRAYLDHVTKFCLGESNATISPTCQAYGSAAPTSGTHTLGEIVWNDRSGAGDNLGWVCTAAGTPGTWLAFGSPSPTIAGIDYLIIPNGTNGCASTSCWQINGVLGPATAASTSQSGMYAPAPRGAGVFIRQIVVKSVSACTGTTTAKTGVSSSGGYVYIASAGGAGYDIQAAPGDTNMWQTMTKVGAASDSSTTIGPLVVTTGGNVDAITPGCEFKMWVDYFVRQ